MEYKKDNHPESTRYIGQHNQEQKNNQPIQGYGYIVRKAEKLTTALYLVTDILSEKEPMKWKTRETGVDILSDITVASSSPLSEKLSTLRVVLKKIDKVVSFLDIASSTRMMSEMNASMLKKEYLALKGGIEAEWNRTQERSKTILSERFFEVREDAIQKFDEEQTNQPHIDGVQGEHAPRSLNLHNEVPAVSVPEKKQELQEPTAVAPLSRVMLMHTPRRVEPTVVNKKPEIHHERITEAQTARVQILPRPTLADGDVVMRARTDVTRDDRRKIILALIKQKPAITVSDISKSISGVSEKTIQRELLAMVAEHVLVKRGERRWSTYALRDA